MKYFNFWKNEALELQEGEEVCSECEGQGVLNVFKDRPAQFSIKNVCQKCWGDGKFDWIEMIMGKACLLSESSTSSSPSISSSSYSVNEKKFKQIKLLRRANERLIKRGRDSVPQMRRVRVRTRRFPLARSSL